MSYLYQEYIDTKKENQKIKLTMHFNKDTYNWATGKRKEKGYQITATPVTITVGDGFRTEEFGAFTGFYDLIYPVERQSKKRLATAIELLECNRETYIDHFRNNSNLEI
jgi:hypothetical protein